MGFFTRLFRRGNRKNTAKLLQLAIEEKDKLASLDNDLKAFRKRWITRGWDSVISARGNFGTRFIVDFKELYEKIKRLEFFQRFDTKKAIELVNQIKNRKPNPKAFITVHAYEPSEYIGDEKALRLIQDDKRLQELIDNETLTMDRLVSRALAHFRKLFKKNENDKKGEKFGIAYTFIIDIFFQIQQIVEDELKNVDQEIEDLQAALRAEAK